MDELKHECGIAAVYDLDNGLSSTIFSGDPDQVGRFMPRMLLDLQNRGQLAAGISSYRPGRGKLLDTYKELGTVAEAFRINRPNKFEDILEEFGGRAVIGHVRYATSGQDSREYAEPFERKHSRKAKWFSFAFNGQLANYAQLREDLLSRHPDYHIVRDDNDTEVILHYLARELQGSEDRPDLVQVFKNLSELFDGAYNVVFLNADGDMVVARDPLGIRPLCYSFDGRIFAAASESVPLQNLGCREIKTLAPGEMILIRDGKFAIHRFAESKKSSHCFFEWIYFANVASTLDDRSVYLSRSKLGQELAEQERAQEALPRG